MVGRSQRDQSRERHSPSSHVARGPIPTLSSRKNCPHCFAMKKNQSSTVRSKIAAAASVRPRWRMRQQRKTSPLKQPAVMNSAQGAVTRQPAMMRQQMTGSMTARSAQSMMPAALLLHSYSAAPDSPTMSVPRQLIWLHLLRVRPFHRLPAGAALYHPLPPVVRFQPVPSGEARDGESAGQLTGPRSTNSVSGQGRCPQCRTGGSKGKHVASGLDSTL